MCIAIDVGYSCVKGVSDSSRVIIPSVNAPYRELSLGDLSKNGVGHIVKLRYLDGNTAEYFIGHLALREGQTTSFTMDREKHRHPNHDVLVLAAAKLLGAGIGTTLVAGLPVAYYRTQKTELQKHLERLHAEVSVNNGSIGRVSFSSVLIYPQGAGALLTAPDLPSMGLVLLVDVGYKTTDYITAEVAGGQVKPVSTLCGSIETGVYNMHDYLAQEFQVITGSPLTTLRAGDIIKNQGKVFYYGKEIDLTDTLKKAHANVARVIADQVQTILGERFAFLHKIYLAGGGVEALPALRQFFPSAHILPDPQWANALGFYKYVKQLKSL